MLGNEIGRLRLVGVLEGISFLLLLGLAVPLKHLWDLPLAVRVLGPIHGALFLAYCLCLCLAWGEAKWPVKRAALVFIACLLPCGPFLIDRGLQRDEEALLESRRNAPVPTTD